MSALRNRRKSPAGAERSVRNAPAERVSARGPLLRFNWRSWRDQHLYSLVSSLGRLLQRPWAALLTVAVLGVALALPLAFFLALGAAERVTAGWREARELTVFLQATADPAAVQALAGILRRRLDVAEVLEKTPAQGLEEFKALSGFADALEVLQYNPLPTVLIVTPRPLAENPSAVDDLVREIESQAAVDFVQYDAAWRQRLGAILELGERVVGVLAALLGLGTLLVVGNTVRLDVQSRAEEIAIVQLLGASDGFVRRPFLYLGFWYGAFGGVIAVLLVTMALTALSGPLTALLESYGVDLSNSALDLRLVALVVGASAALGWLGALLASASQLTRGRPG